MSLYRWEHEDPQHPATEGLPAEAVAALDALMDAVVFDPMDCARSPTEPVGKNVRHLALPAAADRPAPSSTSRTRWSWCRA